MFYKQNIAKYIIMQNMICLRYIYSLQGLNKIVISI